MTKEKKKFIIPDLASEPIWVWQAPEGQGGPKWIAKFGDGRMFPVWFGDVSEDAVRLRAEEFRQTILAKQQQHAITKTAVIEKMKAGRKKKLSPVPEAKISSPVTGPLKPRRGRPPKIKLETI